MLKGENTVVFKHKRADLKIRKAIGLDLLVVWDLLYMEICIWSRGLCVVENPRIDKNL